MIHNIKCKPEYFEPLIAGLKSSEVRENDRNYQVDDMLNIQEFGPQGYTGRSTQRVVTHVLKNFPAVEKNYVVLSLKQEAIGWVADGLFVQHEPRKFKGRNWVKVYK